MYVILTLLEHETVKNERSNTLMFQLEGWIVSVYTLYISCSPVVAGLNDKYIAVLLVLK